ncbi:MAG: hypothetical protein PW735_06945 [Acidobacteriaceae bacterium]|nr:hypothetical protein [Acidobacteriaceae bacterium]
MQSSYIPPISDPGSATPSPSLGMVETSRLYACAIFLLFLSVQADGFGHADSLNLVLMRSALALFLLGCVAMLFPHHHPFRFKKSSTPGENAWRVLFALASLSQLASLALFYKSAQHYHFVGYRFYPHTTPYLFLLAALVPLFVLLQPDQPSTRKLLIAALLPVTIVGLLTVFSDPLDPRRSDMQPLIAAADTSLLHRVAPYHLYRLLSGPVLLTYLPVTWLLYLPFNAAHLDPRLLNLLSVLLLGSFLVLATKPRFRVYSAGMVALLACSPYLQYRHDIYTPPHWLCLIAALLLTARRRWAAAAILLGVSAAMSQFSWILAPFWLLYLFEEEGAPQALVHGAIAAITAALCILPFWVWDKKALLYGILGHWNGGGVNARPASLSSLAAVFAGASHLQHVQAIVLLLLLVWCWRTRRSRSLASIFATMTVALLLFVFFNVLVWGYFFLLIGWMAILCVLTSNDWLKREQA